MRTHALGLAAIAFLMTAASMLGAQTPPASPWRVTLRLSGGLLGLDREVTVASTGELKVSDRRRSSEITRKATPTELAQIGSLVADLKPIEAPRDVLCMDCPGYDLAVQANGRSIVASLNPITLSGTSAEPLVRALSTVLDRELAQPPNPSGR